MDLLLLCVFIEEERFDVGVATVDYDNESSPYEDSQYSLVDGLGFCLAGHHKASQWQNHVFSPC